MTQDELKQKIEELVNQYFSRLKKPIERIEVHTVSVMFSDEMENKLYGYTIDIF